MGKPAKNGVPAVRGDSRGALATTTRHRATAIIGQALDLIANDPNGRDPAAALAAKYWDDPQAFIDWVHARTGEPEHGAGSAIGGQAAAAFAGIFAGAAAQAATQRLNVSEQQPIDVTPARVQDGCDDAQPIDNEW